MSKKTQAACFVLILSDELNQKHGACTVAAVACVRASCVILQSEMQMNHGQRLRSYNVKATKVTQLQFACSKKASGDIVPLNQTDVCRAVHARATAAFACGRRGWTCMLSRFPGRQKSLGPASLAEDALEPQMVKIKGASFHMCHEMCITAVSN